MPSNEAKPLVVEFVTLSAKREPSLCLLVEDGMKLSPTGRAIDEASGGHLEHAATAADFKGKAKSAIEVLAPRGIAEKRIILLGVGEAKSAKELDWLNLGGAACGQLAGRKTKAASLVAETAESTGLDAAEVAAVMAMGALLRSYEFRKYRTKETDETANGGNGQSSGADGLKTLLIHCADPKKAEKAFNRHRAVANGIMLARDLVNEPANELGPVELAESTKALKDVGVKVEILDVADLEKLGMGALLGVAQGSARPARVAVMQWTGAKKSEPPLAFIGKGVVFDTGGISIKPAQGMEDMKGDMGGAACVVGLMHALAERKAKVNAVGIIGCVENMPSHNAQRPGDIVRSMSGQTIEVLNTDAEGRLVLADIMWYAQDRFKPKLMIDLATLTGAIMVALGKEFAGLYSNNDTLVAALVAASSETGEKVWRMPLDKAFDKLIDSKNADMKNIGGRWAGACTAAQFIQRFVKDKDTPWAHIDVAGMAMDSGRNDINQSWGSGWGVRLLDRFVADNHEG
ncbi:MAG: leucyl aminopeptidase [Hyphomicrobiaceae bacterium]|nr:leucyl aminopeptidase [Hyphomicrobiaceae bacterium]